MKKQGEPKQVGFHELVRQKEEADKKILRLRALIGFLSVIIMLSLLALGALVSMKIWLKIAVMTFGLAVGFFGLLASINMGSLTNYYVCRSCKERIVPLYRNVNLASHIGSTRYIKCESCKATPKDNKKAVTA